MFYLLVAVNLVIAEGSRKRDVNGRIYFMVGGQTSRIDELNNRLSNSSYSTSEDRVPSYGCGFKWLLDRNIIDGGITFRAADEQTKQDYRLEYTSQAMFLSYGRNLISSDLTSLYPLIGVGLGRQSLSIHNGGSVSFDSILVDPGRGVELSRRNVLLKVAIGLDRFFILEEQKRTHFGLMCGFRIAYTFPIHVGDWKVEDIVVSGGPDASIEGLSAYLLVGLGGIPKIK